RELLPNVKTMTLASSLLVDLEPAETPLLVWIAFGPPRTAIYFPICLAGELPAAFGTGAPMTTTIEERSQELLRLTQGKERDRDRVTLALERLQAKFDQDAEEFEAKALDYRQHGKPHLVSAVATELMHQHVELFD